MDYRIQLMSFLVSFLFGIFFSFISRFHYDLVYSLKAFMRYLLSFLFILDISLLYVLLLYYVNHGVLHFYFLCVTFLGYFSENYIFLNVKKYVKRVSLLAKKKRKWYNLSHNQVMIWRKSGCPLKQNADFVFYLVF